MLQHIGFLSTVLSVKLQLPNHLHKKSYFNFFPPQVVTSQVITEKHVAVVTAELVLPVSTGQTTLLQGPAARSTNPVLA